MNQTKNGISFESFAQIPGLIHGFSTRSFGSMRPVHIGWEDRLQRFAEGLGIASEEIVRMQQIHSSHISVVRKKHRGEKIAVTDGLFTKEQNTFLLVLAGDCMPLLFYNKGDNSCAIVHAGWRGMLQEIIPEMIKIMFEFGSKPLDILVGLGPAIRSCCYIVGEDLVTLFKEKNAYAEQYFIRRDGKIFFDIPGLARKQLALLGIPEKNIEDSNICTFDSVDTVYSYRKEGKEFGEFVGIIGMRS